MDLPINAYPKIGNKVLVALSGLNRDSKLDDGGYKYDRHYYHISERFLSVRWSKSLIKQLLLYIACSNSDGAVSLISEEEMANRMSVSVRTVRHNNCLLTKAGIIQWERILGDVITVFFPHYLYDILGMERESKGETEDKSTGFTYLEKETVLNVLLEEDVNVIRTVLRFYALSESQLNHDKQQTRTELHVFFKDLTNFLPRYVGYKSKIKSIVNRVQDFFPINVIEGKESVYHFLRKQKVGKSLLKKAKDALVYLLKKEDYTSPEEKHEADTREFYKQYRSFLNFSRTREFLISSADLNLDRDEIGALVTSFGYDTLMRAVKRLYTLLVKSHKDKLSLSLDEHIQLNHYYANASRGLRYTAQFIN